jgi:hypothetical protein
MAKSASASSAQPRKRHDQKTSIRRLQIILAEEEPEDGKAKKFRNVHNESCGEETRKSSAVL